MAAKAIHHSIPGQLSAHINEDYPLFVDFLEGYYEWLELPSSPYYRLRNHLSAMDFKESIDEYASLLRNEYLNTIPDKVIADKELLIKHSKQFYQSLGTEKSFQFLFKILYGEDVELYYPKVDILRASDAHWIDNESLMYVSNSGNVNDLLYRRIEQKRELQEAPGEYEYAYATVNRIINRYANKFNFAELYLTDIEGEFKLTHPVTVDGITEWILPIADEVKVQSPGLNYTSDNSLTWAGDETFELAMIATESGYVDTRYNTIMTASELYVELDGVHVTDFTYNGKLVHHDSIVPSTEVVVRWPIYKGFVNITTVGSLGEIQTVELIDTPFGILTEQTLIGEEGGSGGVVKLIPSLTKRIPGYFMTTDSFPSSEKVLQDSEYYQDYSYVIKAGIDVEKYRDIVLGTLHPAGLKMYSEINIIEFIKLIIRDENFDVVVALTDAVSFISEVPLYNRLGFVEDLKLNFLRQTYSTHNFKNMVVGNIVSNPNKPLNMHWSNIEYIREEPYMNEDYIVDQSEYVVTLPPYHNG